MISINGNNNLPQSQKTPMEKAKQNQYYLQRPIIKQWSF